MSKIALVQINPTVGDLAANQQKILDYIHKAKEHSADIVVFPEMVITGYPPEDLLHKEHFIRDNIKSLKALVKKTKGIAAIVGFVDMDKRKNLYNAAAIIVDGKLKGVYHKQALPNYGVFDEKRYFQPGQKSGVFSAGKIKFSVDICEDIWLEDWKTTRPTAPIHINISSSPYYAGKMRERERLLKKRAKQAKAFICYANLVGGQDELVFDGASLIIDPKGKVVASGKAFEEDLIIADVGAKFIEPVRLAGKKTHKIESIYKALVLGTHDYIIKNGFQKVVIGLSGGIDSSLVAAVAVDAIGKENVVGVSMPSRFTSKGTKLDARRLAKNLGIEFKEMPIEDVLKGYTKALAGEFAGLKSGIAEENIQARIRGNILMALSNKFGWLVLTTGNKSEVAVGYCTLYGDMSGGFAVIKDVPKTIVYELSQWRNREKPIIPPSIIRRAPSAELRANQKDQDSLPPYDILDDLLKRYVEQHHSKAQMARGKDKDLVQRIIQMVDKSEYKRRQAPPGIKITTRAFGKDWRLPITNRYQEA